MNTNQLLLVSSVVNLFGMFARADTTTMYVCLH